MKHLNDKFLAIFQILKFFAQKQNSKIGPKKSGIFLIKNKKIMFYNFSAEVRSCREKKSWN